MVFVTIPLIDKINDVIVNPIIGLMMVLALVYFLFGVVQFLTSLDNEEKRREGQMHMLYGVFGLFVMFSVFGILQIICGTIGCN